MNHDDLHQRKMDLLLEREMELLEARFYKGTFRLSNDKDKVNHLAIDLEEVIAFGWVPKDNSGSLMYRNGEVTVITATKASQIYKAWQRYHRMKVRRQMAVS